MVYVCCAGKFSFHLPLFTKPWSAGESAFRWGETLFSTFCYRTFIGFILSLSVNSSKPMFSPYLELKMGSKVRQYKNYLLKLFPISKTALSLNLVPVRSGQDTNTQTCSVADINQQDFVLFLFFPQYPDLCWLVWGFTSDLKAVSWMNTRGAADAQFNKWIVNQ